jgi:hypothetical protein
MMKSASEIAAIMANDVEEYRAGFKLTAEIIDAMRPGNVRNELIRRSQTMRRAVEEVPRRVFDHQPFASEADVERAIVEELLIILPLMDAVQAVLTIDGDAYDRGEEQEVGTT